MTSPSISDALPKTLQDWRASGWKPDGKYAREVWTPLEEFFSTKGLTLWTQARWFSVVPPNDLPRCPDGFAYTTIYQENSPPPLFSHAKPIHCPARTADNRDVLIRLIAKGEQGLNHLEALRKLAMGPIAFRGENHVVPVLQEIVLEDMTFVTFPLMDTGFDRPWYYNFGEVIDAVHQVLEGMNFCHERLVAHLDLDIDNILIGAVRGARQPPQPFIPPLAAPFREYFPARYYINDLEFAVLYDKDSDPSTRRITGLPISYIPKDHYGRDAAPEMLLDSPYCPFRADVWQLGRMFKRCFGHLGNISMPFYELLVEMSADDPLSRPTVAQALERVRQLRLVLSPQDIGARVVRPPKPPTHQPDGDKH